MKRRNLFWILMAFVVGLTFALTACNDDDTSTGGGNVLTIEQVGEKVRDMPVSTDGGAIENAIDDVFGVDLALPEGAYNAQTITTGDVSAYMVTVSGANTSATEYYNSIKAQMIADGYTAEDSELGFYKVVGTVVYSAAVEADGNDVIIVFGAASPTVNPENSGVSGNSGNPINPGNSSNPINPGNSTNPDILPEGNLDAFPVATINEMFAALGVTIPNCTMGSSYSIDASYNSLESGILSITVTCYGMTAEEREAYKTALKAVGFQSQYYLVYTHNNRYYSELIASSTYDDTNQTFTITFSATYEEPSYVLPENVKIVYTMENVYYYTAIKLGNDYYVKAEYSYDGTTMISDYQYYYKWTGEVWDLWEDYGDGWQKSDYGTLTEMDDVEESIFNFVTDEADMEDEAIKGENTTLLEKNVEVWTYDTGYGAVYTYYKDAETGIVLKMESSMFGYETVSEVTSIDTSVTSFGVELPQ